VLQAVGRGLRYRLRLFLHTHDTPPRTALAFSLGVFIAWTPVFGLHTLIGLGLGFVFGLNRVAVIAGTLINNPWTIIPIYSGSVYLGSRILGTEAATPRLEGLSSWGHVGDYLAQLGPWILPLTTGSLILGSLCAFLSYPIILYGVRWHRALRRAG
jgi:hypothetical protein